MSNFYEDDLATKYAGMDCTLDGKPARVYGRKLIFAIIAQFDSSLEVEYSWPTVDRIMQAGGQFRS